MRNKLDHSDTELEDFHILCHQVRNLTIINEEEEVTTEENLALEIDQVLLGLKTKALAWLRDLDQLLISTQANSVKSRSKASRSSKSSHSKSSLFNKINQRKDGRRGNQVSSTESQCRARTKASSIEVPTRHRDRLSTRQGKQRQKSMPITNS